ncbi:hypothetical protein [Streptomyces sp. NPDC056468]|uniref:hypothetical protein n=1 Tax=Streptomyces sp. NPDC056468 TaxID=3345830 RepID=UPI00367480E9
MAATLCLAGAAPAAHAQTVVNCNNNPQALQPAINNATAGATLFVTGRCTGNFRINKNLTLIGQGGAVLDGTDTGRVVTVSPQSVRVRLSSLVITNGTDTSGAGGGGISNFGTLTLNYSVVHNNTSTRTGGGINNSGTLTVNYSVVRNNTTPEDGGGIENGGTLTVNSSIVHSNTVTSAPGVVADGGGGISNGFGTLTLSRSIVRNNHAEAGGGIDNSGTTRLISSAVHNNSADGLGGGIRTLFDSTLTLDLSSVRFNSASAGGGIFNIGGTATATRSIVRDNNPNNCVGVSGCSL